MILADLEGRLFATVQNLGSLLPQVRLRRLRLPLLDLGPVNARDGASWLELPEAKSPDIYGTLLLDRTSTRSGVKPVVFSHFIHRTKHTCRVCHFELEFNMLVNSTEITEAANRSGRYCGAKGCHDGEAAFGHEKPHCDKCHNGNRGYGKEAFGRLADFPKTKFGNGIDWTQALEKGRIAPASFLLVKPPVEVAVIKPILLEAEWRGIPAAVFSHKAHMLWLDCNNCHPDIFNIKKKTTKHFSMNRILKWEFCGVCHLTRGVSHERLQTLSSRPSQFTGVSI